MNNTAEMVNIASGKATLWGVIIIILGLLAMGAPLVTGLAVALMLGAVLLISGLAQTAYAFQADSLGRGFLRVVFGGVTALAGLAVLTQPGMALATLTLFLAVYFLVDGILAIIAGMQVAKGRAWFILNGVITLVLGAMIWQGWPASTVVVVGVLVGIRLLLTGATLLAIGAAGRKAGGEIAG